MTQKNNTEAVTKSYGYAAAMKDLAEGRGATVESSDGFRSWEKVGNAITGTYIGKTIGEIQGKQANYYEFEPLEGSEFAGMFGGDGEPINLRCHGTYKLDELMANIEPGEVVHVVFKEEVRTAEGNPLKLFDVVLLNQS